MVAQHRPTPRPIDDVVFANIVYQCDCDDRQRVSGLVSPLYTCLMLSFSSCELMHVFPGRNFHTLNKRELRLRLVSYLKGEARCPVSSEWGADFSSIWTGAVLVWSGKDLYSSQGLIPVGFLTCSKLDQRNYLATCEK